MPSSDKGFSVSGIARGGLWLYLGSITNNLVGFTYWLIISGIAGASALGLTSTVVSLGGLISGALSLGIPSGLQRFLGLSIGRGDSEGFSRYFWSSAAFMFPLYGAVSLTMAVLGMEGFGLASFSPSMLILSSALVFLGAFSAFDSLLISTLRTDLRLIAFITGGVLKLSVGISLVEFGFGWVGAFLGYLAGSAGGICIEAWFALRFLVNFKRPSLRLFTEILRAGLVSWIPRIIVLITSLTGVLAVFGFRGAVETGYYYVARAIAGVVVGLAGSMASLLLPVLSGLGSGRERAAGEVLRLSMAVVAPLVFWTTIYSRSILELLGKGYGSASLTLVILVWAALIGVITGAVNSLIYSYGRYRHVLGIGLTVSIPSLILYAYLVPKSGGLGAAESTLIGAVAGLSYAIPLGIRQGFRFSWGKLALTLLLPATIAFPLWLLKLNIIVGALIISLAYIAYLRLGVITRRDAYEIASAVASKDLVRKLYERFRPIVDTVVPE